MRQFEIVEGTGGYRQHSQIANFDQEFVNFRHVLDRRQTSIRNLSIFGPGGFAAARSFAHWSGEGFSAIAGAKNHGQARFSFVSGCENIAPHS